MKKVSPGEKNKAGLQENKMQTKKIIVVISLMVFMGLSTQTIHAVEKVLIGGVGKVALLPWGVVLPARIDIGDAQTISYRASILVRSRKPRENPPAQEPYPAGIEEKEQDLAERLVAGWKGLSPPERLRAVADAASGEWGNAPPASSDLQEWAPIREKFGARMAFLILLRAADLPARIFRSFAGPSAIGCRTTGASISNTFEGPPVFLTACLYSIFRPNSRRLSGFFFFLVP
jgi:hypothetical protein